jgi:hypothetical protein
MKIGEGKGANRSDLRALDFLQLHHRYMGSCTAICLEGIEQKSRPFSVKSASPDLGRLVSLGNRQADLGFCGFWRL